MTAPNDPHAGRWRAQPVDGHPRPPGAAQAARHGLSAASLPFTGPPAPEPADGLRAALRQRLSSWLAQQVRAEEDAGIPAPDRKERRIFAQPVLADAAEEFAATALSQGSAIPGQDVERATIDKVLDEFFGMGGLEPLLRNPEIENININACDQVFVRYADGRREQVAPVAGTDADLVDLIRELAARSGVEERHFDRGSPGVSFQLPGGERAFAVMAVTARPALAIRRHRFQQATLAQLRKVGTVDHRLQALLAAMARARKNVLITGGTAIGKTTLLRAMAAEVPPAERLVTIEDTFELGLDADPAAHPDVLALQAREANIEGEGAVELAELVRWALRMSPDRVIVGEVRGPEVIPMCNAMSQGNDGSMGTLHASTSAGAFTKLAAYAAQGPERLTVEATNLLIASAIHFVVHLDRPRGEEHQRVVRSIREVVGADGPQVISNEIFRPDTTGRAQPGVPLRTETLNELRAAGFTPGLLEAG
ncbi:CpaF family protein [Streptomyces phytophilus]|uniref:CpaF family protein n=1 Tax=Streptomyces phytophilus TaxID=722715 RepID=UPI0015F0F7F2|nr:ATPase, T2SS/T4P/T4SS family [Streptomyces phytophilus]